MISTYDQYIAAAKQRFRWIKTASKTLVSTAWYSLIDTVGDPGAGSINPGNTANGLVPTDALAGCPIINAFGASARGFVTNMEGGCNVAGRMMLVDRLFHAGQYGFAAGTTTLTAQPSYSARVPGGTDFTNCEIWIEVSVAFATGTAWQVQVTYTNQSGTTGRTGIALPATAAAGLTQGRMYQLGLQAGDSGVQKIESVIITNGGTAMTAGNFNVLVLRPIKHFRIASANDAKNFDFLAMGGGAEVFDTSFLQVLFNGDGSTSGLPEVWGEISNA
jgi:hypothetical protein